MPSDNHSKHRGEQARQRAVAAVERLAELRARQARWHDSDREGSWPEDVQRAADSAELAARNAATARRSAVRAYERAAEAHERAAAAHRRAAEAGRPGHREHERRAEEHVRAAHADRAAAASWATDADRPAEPKRA